MTFHKDKAILFELNEIGPYGTIKGTQVYWTKKEVVEERNVLVESARIARGKIQSLSKLYVKDFDALILPGGSGAAINLSDLALKNAKHL